MTKKIRSIIFDFDGVLMDSAHIFHEYIKEHKQDFSQEDVENLFNENVHSNELVKHIFENHWKEIDEFYIQRTTKEHFFKGAKELIEKLENHYQLFINTSAPSYNVERFLVFIDKQYSFERILGCFEHKSKVEKFKLILQENQLEKEECLFITDTLGDLKEAEEAQIKSIAVTWGVHKRETLEQGESIAIVDSFEELFGVIQKTK